MSDPSIIVDGMPAELAARLIQSAEADKISVSEKVSRILASTFGIEREDRQTRFVPFTSVSPMIFQVPDEVRRQLRVRAATNGATMRGLVIAALATEFGLPFTDTKRRPRS